MNSLALSRKIRLDFQPDDVLYLSNGGYKITVKVYLSKGKIGRAGDIVNCTLFILLGLTSLYVGVLLLSIAWIDSSLTTLMTALHYIAGLFALLIGVLTGLVILNVIWMVRHFWESKK